MAMPNLGIQTCSSKKRTLRFKALHEVAFCNFSGNRKKQLLAIGGSHNTHARAAVLATRNQEDISNPG